MSSSTPSGPSYHRIILDSVIRRWRLTPPRLGLSEHGHKITAFVEVTVSTTSGNEYHKWSSDPSRVRAKAEDQACQKAIKGLDDLGYKRPHYRNEMNNLVVNGARISLGFQRSEAGPQDQRLHTSRLVVNGCLLPYIATSTQKAYADELACKQYLEGMQ